MFLVVGQLRSAGFSLVHLIGESRAIWANYRENIRFELEVLRKRSEFVAFEEFLLHRTTTQRSSNGTSGFREVP